MPSPVEEDSINGHIEVEDEVPMAPQVAAMEDAKEIVSDVDDSITRCICDYKHDDGYMICCDKCRLVFHQTS